MSLSALIRGGGVATATPATTATHSPPTVAKVATVAVATLLAEEKAAILEWLAHIGEEDRAVIDEVLERCAKSEKARNFCLTQSRNPPPNPTPSGTGTCNQCQHFRRTAHPYLGHCAVGEPESIAGLWATDWRWCKSLSPKKEATL